MAGGGGVDPDAKYSPLLGFVFVFNLIVGAGALTIPAVFSKAGLGAASIGLCVLAFTSYITVTFVVEAMAGVNAILDIQIELSNHGRGEGGNDTEALLQSDTSSPNVDHDCNPGVHHDDSDCANDTDALLRSEAPPSHETDALFGIGREQADQDQITIEEEGADDTAALLEATPFHVNTPVQFAKMAETLFSRVGIIAFYLCMVIYLYGDLTIYAVTVPKSLRELTCPAPADHDRQHHGAWQCFAGLDSTQLYRRYVLAFGVLLGAFAFGSMQNTKHIQVVTTVIRHAAFIAMVAIALVGILNGRGRSAEGALTHVDYAELPNFFGVCVYSFMCHHSLPGLLSPISNKLRIPALLAADYLTVVVVYLLLCVSALLRFNPDDIQDVYSLNFQTIALPFFPTFLALFPVFTLSTNFPVIAITLRETLRTLASSFSSSSSTSTTTTTTTTSTSLPPAASSPSPSSSSSSPCCSCCSCGCGCSLSQFLLALFAVLPPLAVAALTDDVSMLVGYTGSYAGMFIQWVIPACLVYAARRRLLADGLKQHHNPFRSPFRSNGWVFFIFAWSLAAFGLITYSHLSPWLWPHK